MAGQDHIFYPPDGREFANPHDDWHFGPYGQPPAPGSLAYPPFLPDRPKELGQQKADTTPFPGALPQPFGYYPNPPLRYNPYLAPYAPYPFP